MSRLNQDRVADERASRNGRVARVAAVFVLVAIAVGIGWHAWRGKVVPALPRIDLAGVDTEVADAVRADKANVQAQPRSAAAWGRLGMTLFANRLNPEAVLCLAQAERLDGKDPRWPYYQGMIQLSQDEASRDENAALACLGRAVARRSGDIYLRVRLAEALLAQDRLDEADAQFRYALEGQPGNVRAELGLGDLAYRRGDLAAAKRHLMRVIAGGSAGRAAHVLLARVYQRLGDESSAAREQGLATEAPDDTASSDPWLDEVDELKTGRDAHLARGERLFLQGDVRAGLTLLQGAAAKYPDYDRAYLFLGRAYFRLKDFLAARAALAEAVRLAPSNVEARFLLGSALQVQKEYRAASECFRQVLAIKPDHALAHYNLAQCLLQEDDRQGAMGSLRAALRYMPNLAEAHRSLGKLLAQDGQDAEAIQHLEDAVRLAPSDARAKELLGKLRDHEGQR